MSKWKGAAAWSAKEARVGDRLPYARLVDENTLLLRGAKSHRETAKHFGAPGAHTDGRTRRRGAPCSASHMRWWLTGSGAALPLWGLGRLCGLGRL